MSAVTNFTIYYQNVRSLKTKSNDFFSNVLCNNFTVIALTETWLNNSFYNSEVIDDRYIVFRNDRSPNTSKKKHGGGVLLAIKSSFEVERFFDTENT